VNRILLETEDKKTVVIKEIDKLFHGKIVIHFAGGLPRKVEVNKVEDIKIA
jgi:AAA15 family ATPase/GTPase